MALFLSPLLVQGRCCCRKLNGSGAPTINDNVIIDPRRARTRSRSRPGRNRRGAFASPKHSTSAAARSTCRRPPHRRHDRALQRRATQRRDADQLRLSSRQWRDAHYRHAHGCWLILGHRRRGKCAGLEASAPLISGSGLLKLNTATVSSAASVVNAAAIFYSGKLDLSNNTLVVTYSGSSPYANLRAAAATGYNGGLLNGAGLTSEVGMAATPWPSSRRPTFG